MVWSPAPQVPVCDDWANVTGWTTADFVRLWIVPVELLMDQLFIVGLFSFWYEADRLEEALACYWARRVFYRSRDSMGPTSPRCVVPSYLTCTPTGH